MKQAIKKDHALLISGFGKFEAYDKSARMGRNRRRKRPLPARRARWWCSGCPRKFREELNGEEA